MSNKVYFGKCISSGSNAQKKIVYMEEIPEQFNEGDLLAVFFTNKNTHETPSIVFRIGSTQQEVSVADDEGIAIKSYDIEVEKEGLWGAGETVLFCFVQRPDNGILYLELIGKLQASNTDYGIVKLNGISENQTLESWFKVDEADDDYKAAINAATVKALIRALFAIQDEDEEEEQPISFGLQWIRNPALTEELFPLGNLSLGNSSASVSIGIPKNLITQEQIQYTGQLINNGMDGTHNPDEEDYLVEPFLTRHIFNDLFFEPGDEIEPATIPRSYLPGNGIALEGADLSRTASGETEGEVVDKPEDTIPYHIRFDKDKLVLGHNDSADFNKVIIRPALEVDGSTKTSGIIDANSAINGTRLYGGASKPNWTSTSGQDNYKSATIVSQGDIYEKNDLLKNRYNSVLMVRQVPGPAQEISANGNARFLVTCPSATTANWEPIGIVGYNVDGTDSSTTHKNDAMYANVWECFMIGPGTDNNLNGNTGQMQVAIKNINTSKSIKVLIELNVLYRKRL